MARQPADKSSKPDDSALIRELALLLDETSLTEIEIERAGLRVRVARNVSVAASVPAAYLPAAAAAPAAVGAAASGAMADPAHPPHRHRARRRGVRVQCRAAGLERQHRGQRDLAAA